MTLNIPITGQRELIDMLNNQAGNFCHISAILGLKVIINDGIQREAKYMKLFIE